MNATKTKSKHKGLLTAEEKKMLRGMWERIDKAMQKQGIGSVRELNETITQARGNSPDRSVYCKIECPPYGSTGEYYNLSLEYLLVIADALGVSTDYLLGRENGHGHHN